MPLIQIVEELICFIIAFSVKNSNIYFQQNSKWNIKLTVWNFSVHLKVREHLLLRMSMHSRTWHRE